MKTLLWIITWKHKTICKIFDDIDRLKNSTKLHCSVWIEIKNWIELNWIVLPILYLSRWSQRGNRRPQAQSLSRSRPSSPTGFSCTTGPAGRTGRSVPWCAALIAVDFNRQNYVTFLWQIFWVSWFLYVPYIESQNINCLMKQFI